MRKEILKVNFDLLLALTIDESVNVFTCTESVCPLIHVKSVFELRMFKLKELNDSVFVFEAHWVRDFGCLLEIRVSMHFHDMGEVSLKNISEFLILPAALELLAKLKQADSDLVIKVQKLAVLTKSVHNDLADLSVADDLRKNTVLLCKIIKVAISDEEEVFRRHVRLMCDRSALGSIAGVHVRKKLHKLVNALSLLDLIQNGLVFLDEVLEHALK